MGHMKRRAKNCPSAVRGYRPAGGGRGHHNNRPRRARSQLANPRGPNRRRGRPAEKTAGGGQ